MFEISFCHNGEGEGSTVDVSAKLVLKGRVTDVDGNPFFPDAHITLHGGLATRWKVGSTETDENGEYLFDPCPYGARVFDEEKHVWDISLA